MRWTALALLGLYLVLVSRLTLADPSSGQVFFTLADSMATRYSGGRLDWGETEVLANVALFVPVGLLLGVALGRPLAAAALCLGLSVGIETAQQIWFPIRVPSLADVQHNVLGGALGAGAALAVLGVRARPRGRVADSAGRSPG